MARKKTSHTSNYTHGPCHVQRVGTCTCSCVIIEWVGVVGRGLVTCYWTLSWHSGKGSSLLEACGCWDVVAIGHGYGYMMVGCHLQHEPSNGHFINSPMHANIFNYFIECCLNFPIILYNICRHELLWVCCMAGVNYMYLEGTSIKEAYALAHASFSPAKLWQSKRSPSCTTTITRKKGGASMEFCVEWRLQP